MYLFGFAVASRNPPPPLRHQRSDSKTKQSFGSLSRQNRNPALPFCLDRARRRTPEECGKKFALTHTTATVLPPTSTPIWVKKTQFHVLGLLSSLRVVCPEAALDVLLANSLSFLLKGILIDVGGAKDSAAATTAVAALSSRRVHKRRFSALVLLASSFPNPVRHSIQFPFDKKQPEQRSKGARERKRSEPRPHLPSVDYRKSLSNERARARDALQCS